MAQRKRITRPIAVRWERNPFHELCKLRSKELGISYKEAVSLLTLEHELAKI
ncbi:hypothetical protein PANI_CDS0012 [Maribacter phage Panino]